MLDVLDEHADSLRLEPPGKEGEGVEFWIRRGDAREYHQVKRQHGGAGHWTLKELGSRMVLSSFQDKLNDSAGYLRVRFFSCRFSPWRAGGEIQRGGILARV
jgi:hypothetical protein